MQFKSGISILSSLFIVIICSLLSAYLMKIIMFYKSITDYEMINTKAELAAFSVLEFAEQKLRNGESCADINGSAVSQLNLIDAQMFNSSLLCTQIQNDYYSITATVNFSKLDFLNQNLTSSSSRYVSLNDDFNDNASGLVPEVYSLLLSTLASYNQQATGLYSLKTEVKVYGNDSLAYYLYWNNNTNPIGVGENLYDYAFLNNKEGTSLSWYSCRQLLYIMTNVSYEEAFNENIWLVTDNTTTRSYCQWSYVGGSPQYIITYDATKVPAEALSLSMN